MFLKLGRIFWIGPVIARIAFGCVVCFSTRTSIPGWEGSFGSADTFCQRKVWSHRNPHLHG